MSDSAQQLGLYLHLARASERRRRPHVRDRLLVLSGVIAARMDLSRIAAYCRHAVLQHNPGHMLRRWPTIESALDDPDFVHFHKHLTRRYPQEKAERLLSSLGIDMARERDTYYSAGEYAAALLGVTPEALEGQFGEAGQCE